MLARKRQTSAAAVQAHAAAAIAALSDAEADVREAALTLLDGLEPAMLEEHMVRRMPYPAFWHSHACVRASTRAGPG